MRGLMHICIGELIKVMLSHRKRMHQGNLISFVRKVSGVLGLLVVAILLIFAVPGAIPSANAHVAGVEGDRGAAYAAAVADIQARIDADPGPFSGYAPFPHGPSGPVTCPGLTPGSENNCGLYTACAMKGSMESCTIDEFYYPWANRGCPAPKAWNDTLHTCDGPTDFDTNKSVGPQCTFPAGASPKPRTMCGNPINVAIGNKYQVESDFSLTPLLAFTRYYNSISIGRSDSLGPQWSHTYARNVAYTGAGTTTPVAIISSPEGNRVVFTLSAGVWTADADVIATLVRRDDAHGALLGWTYTAQDGREVEQYDALGRLLQITKSDGSVINLTYNNGVIENNANDLRLTQVQSQDGRSLVFTYDASNRIHQITDPAGGVYLYGYDTSGRLSTVTYPGGGQRTYLYNEPAFTGGATLPNALTGIVHEDGQRFATFNYQSDGRAISTEHAGVVEKFVVQYNADGTSTVTTPLGTTQQRTFSTVLGVKKATGIVETCADCTP
jgi:YD repeat-containing protein